MPDFMNNYNLTFDAIMDCQNTVRRMKDVAPEIKFVAVVQGATVIDAWECFYHISDLDWVDVIMFPRCLNYVEDGLRVRMLMSRAVEVRANGRPIHCLGTYKNIYEVKTLASIPWVRSIDTKLPIKMGFDWQRLTDWSDNYVPHQEDYWDLVPVDATSMFEDGDQEKLIYDNCRTFGEWCRGDWLATSPGSTV